MSIWRSDKACFDANFGNGPQSIPLFDQGRFLGWRQIFLRLSFVALCYVRMLGGGLFLWQLSSPIMAFHRAAADHQIEQG